MGKAALPIALPRVFGFLSSIVEGTGILENLTSILVADDHPLYRDALVSALEGLSGKTVIDVSGTFDAAMEQLRENADFDVVLLDLNMPGSKGLSGLSQIRSQFPSIPVVIVSATEDAGTIRKSIAMGASGYVRKSSSIEEMRNAVTQVLEGDIYTPADVDLEASDDSQEAVMIERLKSLTPQQTRVLGMLGKGLLNKQIAYELSVSEATVKAHVSAILLKLRVDSRTQAVIEVSKLTSIGDDVDGDGHSA